jgi:hypothetical protein
MKQIKLITQSWRKPILFALVDDEDFEWLNRFSWSYCKGGSTFYAHTHIDRKMVYMHQLILPSPGFDLLTVDHKDLNGLNNQRENLRLATRSEQRANQRKSWGSTSRYKGVRKYKTGKWEAYIKGKHLGTFYTEEAAAAAYNEAATKQFGEFANLNVIEGEK